MKSEIKDSCKILSLVLLILLLHHSGFSQGTNISREEHRKIYLGLSLSPSQSQILNDGIFSGSKLISDKMISFSGSIDFGYFFSSYFGLSTGAGFVAYKSQLSLGSYQNMFTSTDSENESYERRVLGTDIKETQNVGVMRLPFILNLSIPIINKAGFFFQTGINMDIPLNKNYTSSGTFTYKGYYAVDNVLIENLPDYGFPSNVSTKTDGKLELKSLGFDAIATAGFDYFINEKIQIAVSGSFNKSLSNISGYSTPDKFQLSSEQNQINSLMGGSTKATISSIGVRIALRYYLK